jgi:FHS family L-fucose permease-like MFS transporter
LPLTAATADDGRATTLFRLSIGTYFTGGFVVPLVSLLVPRLKLLMGLDYTQASLVQLAFHSSYLLFAWPITAALVRIGYMRGIAWGTAVMALGCAGFVFAAWFRSYPGVLVALLALAGGITFLQIAGNIVIAVIERADRAVSRMTLLQGFNSVGTMLAPLVGASFLLTEASAAGDEQAWATLSLPFAACVLVLAAITASFVRKRDLLNGVAEPQRVGAEALRALLRDRRLIAGSIATFGYVGAEVTIGTLLTNYLVQPDILGLSPAAAGRLVTLYWAGAMVGRFAGAALFTRIAPPRLLALAALAATALTLAATLATGVGGAAALLAVGLCNAIMYPTLFALSLPDDRTLAPYAAMVLCMAVVGGAVIPVLTGVLADRATLAAALVLPAFCYLPIAAFAWWRGRRVMPEGL